MMEVEGVTLYYNGVDITDQAKILSCVVHDCAGQHLDSIDIEFDEPGEWNLWDPKPDDKVRVTDDVFDTGTMYVTSLLPYEDRYRLMATSCPTVLRAKGTQGFADMTLKEIATAFAVSADMEVKMYGLDDPLLPYAYQDDETAIGFLSRLCEEYGALLKCIGKSLNIIAIRYAQELDANVSIDLTGNRSGASYEYHPDQELGSMIVMSAYTQHTASDRGAESSKSRIVHKSVLNEPQATAISEGLLRSNNVKNVESLWIDMDYSPGVTAIGRADILSEGRSAGKWIVAEVDHDLISRSSSVHLWKCREGIG